MSMSGVRNVEQNCRYPRQYSPSSHGTKDGTSVKRGRAPIHWMLNGVASLSIQPFRTAVSSRRSCRSAASLSIENGHSYGQVTNSTASCSTAAAQPISITREAAGSSLGKKVVFAMSPSATKRRKNGSESSLSIVAAASPFSPRTTRAPPGSCQRYTRPDGSLNDPPSALNIGPAVLRAARRRRRSRPGALAVPRPVQGAAICQGMRAPCSRWPR